MDDGSEGRIVRTCPLGCARFGEVSFARVQPCGGSLGAVERPALAVDSIAAALDQDPGFMAG
ncbi:MAG: hypothetical protein HC900_10125 [Methylacidiphilales bacterium]|nr:hypothetical protein [Candidatus Methylacidiphilales bacterium]